MTHNKLRTKVSFIGLLLGTALLSNSATALAQSNPKSSALKPNVAQDTLELFEIDHSATLIPQAAETTLFKSGKQQPAKSAVAQVAASLVDATITSQSPVASATGEIISPKSESKPTEKAAEAQPVAPITGETTAPKSESKPTEKAAEAQPVAPITGEITAPKSESKPTEKAAEAQPVAPITGETTAPKSESKPTEKAAEAQPVAPITGETTAPKENKKTPDVPGTKQDGATSLSDISGNWAEPFIRVLTDKGIIAGYKDGTFRPDQPVTRAEFAALIRRAFPDAPEVSSKKTFRDVPRGYWAAEAIAKASSIGFLAGDPGGTFRPTDNIKRIESLVSLVNGTKLQANGNPTNIDELFSDTPQVPVFGRNALVAAAQRCVAVSVSYPDGRNFNPTGDATRSDVAAFLHQTLVAADRLPKLPDDSPAQKYIVNCAPTPRPPIARLTEQDVLGKVGIPAVPAVLEAAAPAPVNAPVGGITTPSGFGANWGDFFIAAGYQDRIPAAGRGPGNLDSLGIGVGIGLGDARNLVGLEASYSTSSASNTRFLDRGGVNFKLHKLLGDNVSAAVGYENAISSGYTAANNPGSTVYGVVTGVLPLGDTSNFTASVGAGNGRFRNFGNIATNTQSTNIFGSLGFRATENFALAADYNGRNVSIGLPITFKLGDNVGFQVTPSLLDIAGDATSPSSRFGIGGGFGIRF